MLLPLKMISSCQNVGKSTLFAKFGTVLWFCDSFGRFRGHFCSKMGQIVTKSADSTRLMVLIVMHSLQEGAVARLGFCGACRTETETSRREAGFPRVFCAYKPIYMDCTLLHNGGRSTVWYAYPKEEQAVILRDPLLFNLPCRGRSDSASAGRVPAEAQFTTDKCVDGRSRTFFFPCCQNV